MTGVTSDRATPSSRLAPLAAASLGPAPARWAPEHIAAIARSPAHTIPLADPGGAILAGIDLWDLWPLQHADGTTALFDGWSLWFVLSAPALADPDARHDVARIRLIAQRRDAEGGVVWRDLGHALPDDLCPGSREWAGSALFDAATSEVVLFFTAAGHRGEPKASFAQRLFQTRGRLTIGNATSGEPALSLAGWSAPVESIRADDEVYLKVTQNEGVPGFIKGFRDPAHFRDPADGATYLLFTGSLKASASAWNGCIGIARATDATLECWALLPPLVSADGLNNELERPHVLFRDGLYYLFWSTQSKVFADGARHGPTGLYAMAAPSLQGPWQPVNGSGLVAGNPEAAPYQTYSWWVSDDLSVAGFLDYPRVAADGVEESAAWRRARFGGTPAPVFRIQLDGLSAWVEA